MDGYDDYEKLDEEYPELVIHQANSDSETDDCFDYEKLDSLFPDLLINLEDYEYIVPFDYEKLNTEFPELSIFLLFLLGKIISSLIMPNLVKTILIF